MSFPYLTDLLNAFAGTRFSMPIPTFGTLVMLAILVAGRVAQTELKRQETLGTLPPSTHLALWDLTFVATLAGIVGARLFHILDYPDQFIADPMGMLLSRAGFSIYGGLCFGMAAGVVFLKRRALPIARMLDAVAPSMMLGYGVGRLGCQLAGDGDWGIAADMTLKPHWLPDWLWAQTYGGNIAGVVITPPGVYPTPLYECAAALVLFFVLRALRSQQHRAGYLFSMYLLLAGFERLLVEKIRINAHHPVLEVSLTQAELISLLLIVAGFLGVMITFTRHRLAFRILFSLGVLTALSACVPF